MCSIVWRYIMYQGYGHCKAITTLFWRYLDLVIEWQRRFITSSLIGWDLAQPWIEHGPKSDLVMCPVEGRPTVSDICYGKFLMNTIFRGHPGVGHVAWWALLGLISRCPVFKPSLSKSFEGRAPVDLICEYLIFGLQWIVWDGRVTGWYPQ